MIRQQNGAMVGGSVERTYAIAGPRPARPHASKPSSGEAIRCAQASSTMVPKLPVDLELHRRTP